MMRIILLLSLSLVTLWSSPTLQNMKKEFRVAIVVGNSDYDDAPLEVARTNARTMRKFLEKNGFYVYYGENLDKRNFVRLLRKFYKNLRPNGIGLVYYAGHSVQTKEKNYLVTIDHGILNESMIARKSISLNTIYSSMDKSYNRLNIVILDSAYEKPFGTHFTPEKQGLSPVHSSKLQVNFCATRPNKANDSKTFTTDFISLAKKRGTELSSLKNQLITLRKKHQQKRPTITIAKNQPFYFVLPNHIPSPDALAYSKIKDSNSKEALKKFINKYPKSAYTKKVKKRLARLSQSKQQKRAKERKKFENDAAKATQKLREETKKRNEIKFKLTKPEDVKKQESVKPTEGQERRIKLE